MNNKRSRPDPSHRNIVRVACRLEDEVAAVHRVVHVLGAHIPIHARRIVVQGRHFRVVNTRVHGEGSLHVVGAVRGGQRVQHERVFALRPRES